MSSRYPLHTCAPSSTILAAVWQDNIIALSSANILCPRMLHDNAMVRVSCASELIFTWIQVNIGTLPLFSCLVKGHMQHASSLDPQLSWVRVHLSHGPDMQPFVCVCVKKGVVSL